MADRHRVLEAMIANGGTLTSYEISKAGLSSNPSQRITDLEEKEGHKFDREDFMREDPFGTKRPCTRYTLTHLAADPPPLKRGGTAPGRAGATLTPLPQSSSTVAGVQSSATDSLPRDGSTGFSCDGDSPGGPTSRQSSFHLMEEAW